MPRAPFDFSSNHGAFRGLSGNSAHQEFVDFVDRLAGYRWSGGRGDDTIQGTDGDDKMRGGRGDDEMSGNGGADRAFGGWGDDTFFGGAGDDRFFGGHGDDTAVFSGSILDYSWEELRNGKLEVTGDDGTDVLHRVENLQFDDYSLDLDGDNGPLVVGADTLAEAPKETAENAILSAAAASDEPEFTEDTPGQINVSAYDFDGGSPELTSAEITGDGTLNVVSSTDNNAGMANGVDFTLEFDPGDAYQSLGQGETATETVSLAVSDGQGNTTDYSHDIEIHGVNDAPVFAEDSAEAEVSEDDVLTASGQAVASDVDANDSVTYALSNGGVGTYGTLSMGDDGEWEYLLDNEADAVQALVSGETATDQFTITATDESGAVDTFALTVNVFGADDTQEATTLTFDDLDVEIGSQMAIPDGYGGFTWSANSYVLESDEYRGGDNGPYSEGATSGENVAMNVNSGDFTIARDEAFDLESANFMSTTRFSMELTATGYLDGEEVGSQLFTINTADVLHADFDDDIFDEVDEVTFSTNYNSLGRFVMDDLVFIG